MTTARPRPMTSFGCERLGRLRRVMLHRPDAALHAVKRDNYRYWLFDAVPEPAAYCREHDAYAQLLTDQGVDVVMLADVVEHTRSMLARLPNLAYLHDIAVVTSHGAFLSRMAMPGRHGEDVVVQEALQNLGIPILNDFGPDDAFEGLLALSSDTLFIAHTERHVEGSIGRFIQQALPIFPQIVEAQVPSARRFMHPDMVFNRIDNDLALIYPPALQSARLHTVDGVSEIDFPSFLRARGVELVEVSSEEQQRWACSFVPLQPRKIVHYSIALNRQTWRELERRGVESIVFHPDALLAGGGSLRCLTMRLLRESAENTCCNGLESVAPRVA